MGRGAAGSCHRSTQSDMLRILRAAADPKCSCSTQKLLSVVIGCETKDLSLAQRSALREPETTGLA